MPNLINIKVDGIVKKQVEVLNGDTLKIMTGVIGGITTIMSISIERSEQKEETGDVSQETL